MNTSELISWLKEHNAEEQLLSCFWEAFSCYRQEVPDEFADIFGEFNESLFMIRVVSASLTLTNWPACDVAHVVVRAHLDYKGQYVGEYRLVFELSGELYDDFLVTEPSYAFRTGRG